MHDGDDETAEDEEKIYSRRTETEPNVMPFMPLVTVALA
jgi:hypothetical protein